MVAVIMSAQCRPGPRGRLAESSNPSQTREIFGDLGRQPNGQNSHNGRAQKIEAVGDHKLMMPDHPLNARPV